MANKDGIVFTLRRWHLVLAVVALVVLNSGLLMIVRTSLDVALSIWGMGVLFVVSLLTLAALTSLAYRLVARMVVLAKRDTQMGEVADRQHRILMDAPPEEFERRVTSLLVRQTDRYGRPIC